MTYTFRKASPPRSPSGPDNCRYRARGRRRAVLTSWRVAGCAACALRAPRAPRSRPMSRGADHGAHETGNAPVIKLITASRERSPLANVAAIEP